MLNVLPVGSVHHDNAVPRGGGLVDVVGSDTGAHDRSQAATALQRLGRDLHAAATDGSVEFGQGLAQFRALEPGADLVRNPLRGVQQIQAFLSNIIQYEHSVHGVLSSGPN